MDTFQIKYCDTCALRVKGNAPDTYQCAWSNKPTKLDDFCSHHMKELPKCNVCHRYFVPLALSVCEGHILCGNCAQTIGMCQSCAENIKCAFNESPRGPKVINKQMRQGSMVMTVQVKNEALAAELCADCKCYKNGKCNREGAQGCGEWHWAEVIN